MENNERNEETILHQIISAIKGIRYGYIQIIIQDSRVIQIEKTEKIRIKDKSPAGAGL